jgi:hypothetical protein
MKTMLLIFLTLFLAKECETKSQDIDSVRVEYVAYSRGFYQKMEIKNKKFRLFRDSNSIENPSFQPISNLVWKQMVLEFKKLDLPEIQHLKAPSKQRFHDGAAIAKVTITYKGKIYQSPDFDYGVPPVEIQKFVETINSLIKE